MAPAFELFVSRGIIFIFKFFCQLIINKLYSLFNLIDKISSLKTIISRKQRIENTNSKEAKPYIQAALDSITILHDDGCLGRVLIYL